jgi:hypothetical protein
LGRSMYLLVSIKRTNQERACEKETRLMIYNNVYIHAFLRLFELILIPATTVAEEL